MTALATLRVGSLRAPVRPPLPVVRGIRWWAARGIVLPAIVFVLTSSADLVAAEDEAGQQAADGDQTAAADADQETLPAEADQADQSAEADEPDRTPRERYNHGLALLDAGDSEAAADAFLKSRDEAGPDPELRYRAAFNLGYALASGVAADAEPEAAIATLRQAAAWFNDAIRLAGVADDDARVNLELVSRRIAVLADQLNDGNRLEARLDRLIDDQRSLRDRVRQLLGDVALEDAGTEPIGFQDAFDALASRERALMAEVGDTIDSADEERAFIENTAEAERTTEQQVRARQLEALASYLERARQSLGDARRLLRRLSGERAHRRADAALAELKRAREQLQDPIDVLKAVARDETLLIGQTQAVLAFAADTGISVSAEAGDTSDSVPPPKRPAWLTNEHLSERQTDAAARTGGVLRRFDGVVAADGTAQSEAASDPDSARVLAAVEEALPVLGAGLGSMRTAIGALDEDDPATALPAQQEALQALADAIEAFADLRGLIELAYGGQQRIVALLTPDESDVDVAMSAAERSAAVVDLADVNTRRLERLASFLEEEAAALAETAEAEETSDQADDADAAAAEDSDPQRQEAMAARIERAQALRAEALEGLETLRQAIGDETGASVARVAADETLADLTELRRLYFTLVEHLQELHGDQGETHDETATAQFEASSDDADPQQTGGILAQLAGRQSAHSAMAEAVAEALRQQADAAGEAAAQSSQDAGAGNQPAAPAQTGTHSPETLAEAAEEVRKAGVLMNSVSAELSATADRVGSHVASDDPVLSADALEAALADQVAAMEHIENALLALVPPDQQGGGDSQQQQQQAAPAEAQERQEAMSQREALKRLQAIRDREAERQRRRQSDDARAEPVEKDW